MDPEVLTTFGLSSGEAKVYVALLQAGTSNTREITKRSGVSYSKVYKILDRLEVKGYVGKVIKQRTTFYTATNPEHFYSGLDNEQIKLHERKTMLDTIFPALDSLYQDQKQPRTSVYEGHVAVKNTLRRILTTLRPGENYCVISASYGDIPRARTFFKHFHTLRKERNISLRMLATQEVKGNLEPETYHNATVKYLPAHFFSGTAIYIYRQTVFIVMLDEHPTGFLIESQNVYSTHMSYFEGLWPLGTS